MEHKIKIETTDTPDKNDPKTDRQILVDAIKNLSLGVVFVTIVVALVIFIENNFRDGDISWSWLIAPPLVFVPFYILFGLVLWCDKIDKK